MFDVTRRLTLRVLAKLGLVLAPGRGLLASRLLDHRDTTIDRADEHAEVAADALGFVDDRNAVAVAHFKIDALVRAVPRGDVTEFAADAEVGIDLGDDSVIEVEVAPILD